MVPADAADPQDTYDLLRSELLSHDAALDQIPHCVVISKADLITEENWNPEVRSDEAWGRFVVSSVTREGLADLLEKLWSQVRLEKDREREASPDLFPEIEEWRP